MGQTWPLFCSFHNAKTRDLTVNVKSIDVVLGTQTGGSRMEGRDEFIELWWQPINGT